MICLVSSDDLPYGYLIFSLVQHIFRGNDYSHQGTDDIPHRYCFSSRVVMICLVSSGDLPHGY